MKTKILFVLMALVILASSRRVEAVGTAFTYQGRLSLNGSPANGVYDFQFVLFSQSQFGNPTGPILTNANVAVSDGIFTTALDFGSVFSGTNYWLEISVRSSAGGTFATLTPRQAITPEPYALMSVSASNLLGTLPSAQLSGTYLGQVNLGNGLNSFTGSGAGLTGLNASSLSFGSVPDAVIPSDIARDYQVWEIGGNAGTSDDSIGTVDNTTFNIIVDGARVVRYRMGTDAENLYYNAPNIVAGSSVNTTVTTTVVGATIAGGGGNHISDNSAAPNKVTADFGTVSGGHDNLASGDDSTVGGGHGNTASGSDSEVTGGVNNTASGLAAVASGNGNSAAGASSGVGGGQGNSAPSNDSWVGGGLYNVASGGANGLATVGGGWSNNATGNGSTIGGGAKNNAGGIGATVPGGQFNSAAGGNTFAGGYRAKANHDGAFVWADFNGFDFASTAGNSFRVRATGGVGFATAIDGNGSVTAGVHLLSGDTSWSSVSDRNAKKNFQELDGKSVLEKLAQVPVKKWNYKWESETNTPHIGPMAQDFKAAFYPGRDDKSITTLEFDGVELAAIQGLNQKLDEKEARISALEKELAELKDLLTKQANHSD